MPYRSPYGGEPGPAEEPIAKLTLLRRRGSWVLMGLDETAAAEATVWIQRARLGYRVMPPNVKGPFNPLVENMANQLTRCLAGRPQPALAYSGFDIDCRVEWEQSLNAAGWTSLSCADRFGIEVKRDYAAFRGGTTVQWAELAQAWSTVSRVLESAWAETADPLTTVRRGRTTEYLRDLAVPGSKLLMGLLKQSGKPAGVIIASCGTGTDSWILDIAVVPDLRRRGLASTLVRESLRRLSGEGARTVFSLIDRGNIASLRLHERLGFSLWDGDYRTFSLPIAC